MSRCFPFPPPGYEKNNQNDEVELLAKEKRKEKKHKKEKRDREKKEGKEQKDGESSKEKHREKKDRKEKRKDKRKDKDREKSKSRITDEKHVEGRIVGNNVETVGERGQRINENSDSRFSEELVRRISDEETCVGNQMVNNFNHTIQRGTEGACRPKEEIEKEVKGKEKIEDKEGEKKTVRLKGREKDKDRDREEKRSKRKDKEKNKERDKEKEKEKEKVKEKGEHKHKERDKHRKSSKKDQIDRPVTIKSTFPAKDDEKISLFPAKEPKDQIDPLLTIKAALPTKDSQKISLFPTKDSVKVPSPEVNLKKRKNLEANGIFHDDYTLSNKLPRPVTSPHLQMENGRKVETGFFLPSDDKIGRVVDNKERRINGKIEPQPLLNNLRPAFSLEAIEKGGESSKPPHPDSQHLSQILSIPKMEEWSDFDDQEWLFGNDNLQSKANVGLEVDVGTPQVWAKTLRIESKDMYALPYVLPF